MKSRRTRYLRTNPLRPSPAVVGTAALYLRTGGLVAFPTETVYGLGANAFDNRAVEAIFRAKGRPGDNPLIVHVALAAQLCGVVSGMNPLARRLAERFWPGPLTMILPRGPAVSPQVTAGLDTVAVRVPSHPVARALILATGKPVAAPSANLSGKPSPTSARHVLRDLWQRVDVILDGGEATIGLESTVVDVTGAFPVILRPGGVTLNDLERLVGRVEYDPAMGDLSSEIVPRSPGMKYRHYAPEGEVYLFRGELPAIVTAMADLLTGCRARGLKVGILASRENARACAGILPDHLEVLASREEPAKAAANLYAALRNCDIRRLDVILAEAFPTTGLGAAFMNRLLKAAGNKIIDV